MVAQYADPASRAPRVDGDGRYLNRVRLAGVKFWLDGSMDNAFMSQPYTNNPPGNTEKNFRGLAVDPQAAVETTVATYWKSNRQVAGHSIGDQAVDNFLVAIEKAYAAQGPADHRPIIQHAQFLRPDQIVRAKKVGAITSFTAGGIYPMGDYLARLMGPERVAWAGAAGSVQRAGIPWTMHHDMPAGVSPSLIYALWNIVNRTTKSGVVLSPQEKVSAYDGLRAITINGAYQFHEEKTKGSLEPGKLADLVVLSANPLKVDPMSIKEIQVLETIKEGTSLYRNPSLTAGGTPTAAAPINEKDNCLVPSSYVIGEHFEKFIKDKLQQGRYASASEVIRDGLRALEDREKLRALKLQALRADIQQGINSGPGRPVQDVTAELQARYQDWAEQGTPADAL